jgi:hypothetical protein
MSYLICSRKLICTMKTLPTIIAVAFGVIQFVGRAAENRVGPLRVG